MAPLFIGVAKGFGGYGFGRLSRPSGPVGPFVSATGGNFVVEPGNGYKYHTFTSPGILTATSAGTIQVLVIAGGGGGGSTPGQTVGGGGGGGGGYVTHTFSITPGSYPVGVGTSGVKNTTGGDSTFHTYLTAKGGGGGGFQGTAGKPGGCSGGGAGATPANAGSALQPGTPQFFPEAAGRVQQGSNGSPGSIPLTSGGGGGGATTGANSVPTGGGGGAGVQQPAFTGPLIGIPALGPLNGYFCGGGGGGKSPLAPGSGGAGGLGGGGAGGRPPNNAAVAGVQYSGGGGGGGWLDDAKPGGQGIVIVRYLVQ